VSTWQYPYYSDPPLTPDQDNPPPGHNGGGNPPPGGGKGGGKSKNESAAYGSILYRLQLSEVILTQEEAGTPPVSDFLTQMQVPEARRAWRPGTETLAPPIAAGAGSSPATGQLDWLGHFSQPQRRPPLDWFVRVLYPVTSNSMPPVFTLPGLVILGLISRGFRIGPMVDGEDGPTFGELTLGGASWGVKE
jgi:hypothetical protein